MSFYLALKINWEKVVIFTRTTWTQKCQLNQIVISPILLNILTLYSNKNTLHFFFYNFMNPLALLHQTKMYKNRIPGHYRKNEHMLQ